MSSTVAFVARVLLSSLFLVAGARKIFAFQGVAQMMAAKGLPSAEILLILTILLELGGGLLLIMNRCVRIAAVALAVFTLAAGALFHDFWSYHAADPGQFNNQLNHFLKNIAIVGGLLHVAASSPRRPDLTSSPEA